MECYYRIKAKITIYQAKMGKANEDLQGWLRKRCIKRTTEGLIMAAQEQAIRINNAKAKIDKTQINSTFRMCEKAKEGVDHAVSKRSKLVQKEYKRRHDWFGTKIH